MQVVMLKYAQHHQYVIKRHMSAVAPDQKWLLIACDTHNHTHERLLQVVGRVQLGQEVLQKILDLGTNAHDEPGGRVTVSACGMTNHKGAQHVCSCRVSLMLQVQAPGPVRPDCHLAVTTCRGLICCSSMLWSVGLTASL